VIIIFGFLSILWYADFMLKLLLHKTGKDCQPAFFSLLLIEHALKAEDIAFCCDSLKKGEYGKPYIENSPVKFNVSHSGAYAGIAVSGCEIGLDIQKITQNIKSTAKKILPLQDKDYYNSLNENDKSKYLCLLWTIKESHAKYLGTGLKDISAQLPISVRLNIKGYQCITGSGKLFFSCGSITEEYLYAVCSPSPENLTVKYLTNDELLMYT